MCDPRDGTRPTGRRGFLVGAAGVGLGAVAHSAFGGAASAQQARITGPFINAVDHGASNEGTADAAAALDKIFRTVEDAGAEVMLPPGRYRIAQPLVVPPAVTLRFAHGAVLIGNQSLRVTGSIAAGLHQIFEGTRVEFGPGSVSFVLPQWWGARGDGVHDDTSALQAALNARIVFLPAGKYRTTRGLVVRNRSSIVGVGNSWSPTSTTDSWIQYDGPVDANAAVLRVAAASVGVDPSSAIDSVHIERVVLNGGNRAGYGLYSVYCTNDSSFSDVTARHCTRHGIFVSQQWYASYRNLVARDNAGCGITIGGLFDGWREQGVNGIEFSNLRAANNGGDARFAETTNLRWGYGVLFRPGAGTVLRQVVSEKNYGPGLIYDLGPSSANRVDGAYLEKNGLGARAAGAQRNWGLVVIGHRNARANSVCSVYLNGATGEGQAQSVWLTGEEPVGTLEMRDISLGQHLRAEWARYAFRGYVYPGISEHITGRRPDGAEN